MGFTDLSLGDGELGTDDGLAILKGSGDATDGACSNGVHSTETVVTGACFRDGGLTLKPGEG